MCPKCGTRLVETDEERQRRLEELRVKWQSFYKRFCDLMDKIADLPQELLSKYSLVLEKGRRHDDEFLHDIAIYERASARGLLEWRSLGDAQSKMCRGSLSVDLVVNLCKEENDAKEQLDYYVSTDPSVHKLNSVLEPFIWFSAPPELVSIVSVGTQSFAAVSGKFRESHGKPTNICKIAFYRGRVFSDLTAYYDIWAALTPEPMFSEPMFSGKHDLVRAAVEIAKTIDANIIRLQERGLL